MEKGLVAEILAKHGQSAAPESRQIVAVLQAVSEVIRAEGLPVSPTSLFAAIMAALDKPETRSSEEVRCYQPHRMR